MNNTSKARGLAYAAGFLGSGAAIGIAMFLSANGYADYDASTGVLDVHPINVFDTATRFVSWALNGLAALAVFKRWGTK